MMMVDIMDDDDDDEASAPLEDSPSPTNPDSVASPTTDESSAPSGVSAA